jgi:timeless
MLFVCGTIPVQYTIAGSHYSFLLVYFYSTASSETSEESAQLHQQLITLFERELVLEIVLVIGQEMELRENAQYNLLMMELLHHLLRSQDPTAVARTGLSPHSSDKASASSNPSQKNARANTTSSSLLAKLKQEKTQKLAMIGARHAHFGGTWMKQTLDGKRSYFGATKTSQPQSVPQRKNRKAEPFIGSGRTSLAHSKHTASDQGPVTKRAQRTLHTFCQRFVKDCYGPVMKSLKNEFRRDSVRLEEGDKVVFFRIVWFFCQWCRMTRNKNVAMGQLIFTMDVFTFNLVLNATDTFYQHKKYTRLAQTVALYSEMMHLLHDMFASKESTENIMAMGLLDRLFYGSEPLDRLPKLLSRWVPGTTTREYLCDLAEVSHVSLKLLDAYTKSCREFKELNQRATDAVSKMKFVAADFDVKSYFARKIVSNQVVIMYTHLLSQYSVNAAHVNHRIIALFLRLSRVVIASPDDRDPDLPLNLLATKKVTLEPMLYNIHLFAVMEKVLNDSTIRRDKEYASLLTFCTNVMNKFAAAAQKNPMLYVECLFRHATPHKFCDLATNLYVTEELRLIAEHELLLEDQRGRLDEMEDEPDQDDDEDDEEVEFSGDTIGAGKSATSKPSMSKRSRAIDSDDEDEVEFENKQEADEDDAEGDATKAVGSTGVNQSRIVDSEDEDEEMESESKETADDDTVGDGKSGEPASFKQSRIVDSDDEDEEVEFDSKEEANDATVGDVMTEEPASSQESRAVDSDDDEAEVEFKSKEETDENDVSGDDGNASESAKPKQSRIVDSDDEAEAEFESEDEMAEGDAASSKASDDEENNPSSANTIDDKPADATKRKGGDLTVEAPSSIVADKRQRLDKSPAVNGDSDEEVEFS